MASGFREGESVYFPFQDGKVMLDANGHPRMYSSIAQFQGKCPMDDSSKVTLIEYAPLIRATWEYQKKLSETTGQAIWQCSNCHYPVGVWTVDSVRCPSCGAIMVKVDD